MTTQLEHLLKLANYALNETYSADYHSSLEDFENDKIQTINSLKKSASEELIDSIDKIFSVCFIKCVFHKFLK